MAEKWTDSVVETRSIPPHGLDGIIDLAITYEVLAPSLNAAVEETKVRAWRM
jgi:hypothetical protein